MLSVGRSLLFGACFLLVPHCATGSDSPLSYPTPPNPFAAPGAMPEPPKSVPPPPRTAPPTGSSETLPGGSDLLPGASDVLLGSGGGGGLLGDAPPSVDGLLPPPAEVPLPSSPFAAMTEQMPPASPFVSKPAARSGRLRWRPVLCLAALSAACAYTRPGEAALISALDSHQGLVPGLAERDELPALIDLGIGSVATHGDLLWLGVLGRWLPLVPTSLDALSEWSAVAGVEQTLLLAMGFFYLLRKVLPRGTVDRHLAVSLDTLLKRGRLHTLVTAAISPAGLVHWLHAVAVLIAVSDTLLDGALGGRFHLMAWWFASAASSAVAIVLSQLVLGRRAQPRSAVSGGAMGMVLMRAAVGPDQAIELGALALPPLRAVLLHLLLDNFSNGLAPPGAIGVEKLLAFVGPAVLVAVVRPQAREMVGGILQSGGWREVLSQMRSML